MGVLALAMEDDVQSVLQLPEATRNKLGALIEEREGEALELAYAWRDLADEAREEQLAAFRTASEEQGLKLLAEDERATLRRIELSRRGWSALADVQVANQLALDDTQRQAVAAELKDLASASVGVNRRERTRLKQQAETRLGRLLTAEQQGVWAKLTEVTPAAPPRTQGRDKPRSTEVAAGEDQLRFSFRFAPWAEVIEWFAEQADLSLVMDAPPQGTLNYTDPRVYTAAQAIDLLNSVLLTKGYTLVRRERMLMVVNLEDGIPPNLITEVSLNELDERGEYELVRCLFELKSAKAVDVEEELSRLVGPQGTVAVLEASNGLVITETAGRLRTFRTIIEAAEQQQGAALGQADRLSLNQIRARDVLATWRKLLGLTEEENVAPDGSLRVAQGRSSRELVISGQPHRVEEFKQLVRILDAPLDGGAGLSTPQLEVYAVADADPASVLEVMQTLMEDEADVRLASDPQTGNLVALARPELQRTIRATLDQMQQDRRQVEVVRLQRVDPQIAMMSIEKLFGPPEGTEEGAAPQRGPRIDADPITRSLLIRGSAGQIKEIKELLAKMGEREPEEGDRSLTSGRGNLRLIPIDAGAARRALDQLQALWPAVRENRIRIVRPAGAIRRSSKRDAEVPADPPELPDGDSSTQASPGRLDSRFVAQLKEVAEAEPADVIVTIGEQGLLIASEDMAALDAFEQVFRTVSDRLFTGSKEMAVFYLQYAKAEVAAELIKQFLGGGASSSGGGGSLLGTLAGAALGGGEGGGLIGSLLGGGGGGSGSIRISGGAAIVADPRLNAIVVQATPKDLDFMEQLLKVLDTPGGPDPIETIPRPRTILVNNTDAESVAEIVRNVYATRLMGQSGGGNRQPSPEEFIRAMSGQKNTGRAIKDAVSEQLRMTISVDSRRNALIVVAPDSLFQEVETLVSQLDYATPELEQTIRYGQTAGSSPELIRNALTSIMGEDVTSDASAESKPKPQAAGREAAPSGGEAPSPEQIKRRLDFIRALQKQNAKRQAEAGKKAAAGKK